MAIKSARLDPDSAERYFFPTPPPLRRRIRAIFFIESKKLDIRFRFIFTAKSRSFL